MTDPTGKPCPQCGAAMSRLSSVAKQLCTGCGAVEDWPLKDGQAPLITKNRDRRKK